LAFAPPSTYKNCITLRDEVYSISNPTKNLVSFPEGLKADLRQVSRNTKASKRKGVEIVESRDKLEPEKLNSLLPENKTIVTEKYNSVTDINIESDNDESSSNTDTHDNDDKRDDDSSKKKSFFATKHTSISEITDLLNVLPDNYFEGYNEWLKVGAIIFHELGNNQSSKELFLQHSRRSPRHAQTVAMNDVERVWRSYKAERNGKATKASLYAECKKVDIEMFHTIQKRYVLFDFSRINTTNLAEYFVKRYGDSFIQTKDGSIYYWNGNIWNNIVAHNTMLKMIGKNLFHDLSKLLHESYTQIDDPDTFKTIMKGLLRVQDRKFKVDVEKDILTELPISEIDFDVNSEQWDNLQFRNGVLMLDKITIHANTHEINLGKAFRKRVKEDYVSMTLPYNFAKPRIENIERVHEIFRQIQPEKDQRDFQFGWLAYCLTGQTGEQVFKVNIGYSAANGKSTEQKIHKECASIYTHKLHKTTFNENNPKQHKQLGHLITKPVRCAFIEEIDRQKMDTEAIKDSVDGYELTVEIMYGTTETKAIQMKLSICTNRDLNANVDKGFLRRGLLQYYESQFLSNPDPTVGNQFPIVKDVHNQFREDDDLKRAYLWVLLPYVVQFYAKGLHIPCFAKTQFNSIAEEYDQIKTALFDVCEIGTKHDKIFKDDLVEKLSEKLNKNMNWTQLLPEMKRMGYKYDRQARIASLCGKSSCKGVIYGLKWNADILDTYKFVSKVHNDDEIKIF
jgi:hypothetical protein